MSVLKSPGAKAMLAFVIVMAALIFALWPRVHGDSATSGPDPASLTGGVTDEAVSAGMLNQARTDAALAPCPQSGAPVPGDAALKGVSGICLADGKPIDLGQATAGRPTVINLWAVWCLPCRRELPLFDELYRRAGDRLDVLAVHSRDGGDKPYAILSFLKELGVHLPTVADPRGDIAGALRAPRVYPSTVLIRADGTVAAVLPRVFGSYDDLAAVVRTDLGVDVSGGGS
ncbi:TlpA family protein disulfide reductase [Gordonia sp. PP30]|uniref:TlpA disulfide reductase family protein n=1 Tax=Gordonia sp. PP30 TaxID=2935861 RepID=UPI001FFF9392|nr:TlpA disulfide reductase family protein [Gordonia sp. PP30]UQE75373.1 TlpA family protein disulfide reductase [Gordonia sp. PP30]